MAKPMKKTILITGGAGFIGSHLADELLSQNYRVRVLDNLSPQVHGEMAGRPAYLSPEVEMIVGDVRNKDAVERALLGVDAVYHFAAIVGVGQSMYEIERYVSVNETGTAVLLEALMRRPVERLVVASSMSVYGEGLYRRRNGSVREGYQRSLEQLKQGDWELYDEDGSILEPIPTPETKIPHLASVYALGKYAQERMSLIFGEAYRIPTVALRFFNVFGQRQALSNPYTGVLAIFASRLLNGNAPLIFEDGNQKRDFVSVYDVARACRLALEHPEVSGRVFNIASGRIYTVREVAESCARALGKPHLVPEIARKYRFGDVRHCFADITAAREALGYHPAVTLEDGLVELAEWVAGQLAEDQFGMACAELAGRGLTV
jgi:dTDP-L-rhamnose 4-epimerase